MKDEKNKNFDDSAYSDELERLKIDPHVKPFTKFKIAELSLCAVAVILGLVYMYTELIPLGVLLPVYCVFFAVIPILRAVDVKRSGGNLISFLPAVCWGFLAVCMVVATIAYFLN